MSADLTIDGSVYISSKRAAEITGYSQDYVGQLARAGKIASKRVGGLWYVVADSILGHKKVADTYVPEQPKKQEPIVAAEDASTVTLDGRMYVSAARAAKLTSYHQDYIGQLARAGKIESRQVGRRRYVDAEALNTHKNEKDALLAAVQVQSVGLSNKEKEGQGSKKEELPLEAGLHYRYENDSKPLMPVIQGQDAKIQENYSISRTIGHTIPVRVVRPETRKRTSTSYTESTVRKASGRIPGMSTYLKVFSIFAIVAVTVVTFNLNINRSSLRVVKIPEVLEMHNHPFVDFFRLKNIILPIQGLFSREIVYTRD